MDNNLYVFWFGGPMGSIRERNLQLLKDKTDMEVVLINEDNLNDYLVEPLHKIFPHLIPQHKADYLRCYFMHFYGGGYSDIKEPRGSWTTPFIALKNSNNLLVGYPEVGPEGIANMGGDMQRILIHEWKKNIGVCSMICKSNTEFTTLWYRQLVSHCNHYYDLMITTDEAYLDEKGYPKVFKWSNILGNIFHPLAFYYKDQILKSNDLLLNFNEYRDTDENDTN